MLTRSPPQYAATMKAGTGVSLSNLSALFTNNASVRGDSGSGGGGDGRSSTSVPPFAQDEEPGALHPAAGGDDAVKTVPESSPPNPATPLSPPPRYGDRSTSGWRPTSSADFGGGGAFPEVGLSEIMRASSSSIF